MKKKKNKNPVCPDCGHEMHKFFASTSTIEIYQGTEYPVWMCYCNPKYACYDMRYASVGMQNTTKKKGEE